MLDAEKPRHCSPPERLQNKRLTATSDCSDLRPARGPLNRRCGRRQPSLVRLDQAERAARPRRRRDARPAAEPECTGTAGPGAGASRLRRPASMRRKPARPASSGSRQASRLRSPRSAQRLQGLERPHARLAERLDPQPAQLDARARRSPAARRDRARGCARRCPSRIRRAGAAAARRRQQVGGRCRSKRCTSTARGSTSTISPRRRLGVQRLAAALERRIDRRALLDAAGQRRAARRRSRRSSSCGTGRSRSGCAFGVVGVGGRRRGARRFRRPCARRAGRRRSWSLRRSTAAAGRWRADRGCRYARPLRRGTDARTRCSAWFELRPCGLSSSRMPSRSRNSERGHAASWSGVIRRRTARP